MALDFEILHDILALSPRKTEGSETPIDVIVPVYKGLMETLRCLHSLLVAKPTVCHEIVVINDDSPDLLLVRCLRKIADRRLQTVAQRRFNFLDR